MVATDPSTPQLRDPFRPEPLSLPQALTDALRLTPEQFALLVELGLGWLLIPLFSPCAWRQPPGWMEAKNSRGW